VSRLESLIKSVIYRLFGTIVTFLIAYLFTREFFIASGIAILEMIAKTILYYAYERFWNKFSWVTKNKNNKEEG
jgi:uncharacterized membrane protein